MWTPNKQEQIDHFTLYARVLGVGASVGPYGAHHTLKKVLGLHNVGGTS